MLYRISKTEKFVHPGMYLGMLIGFVAVMSFFVWMKQGIRLDEAQSIWQTSRDLPGVLTIIAKDVHVPFYFVGLHFWEVLFGTGLFTIRFFSLLFFFLALPAIFYLAKESYNYRVAYGVALMTAVSPFLNWYGSEARMYSLIFLLTTCSHLLFVRLWKAPQTSYWYYYAIVSIVGLFTHFFFAFVVVVQVVFFLTHRTLFAPRSSARFSLIALVALSCVGAWFWYRNIVGAGLNDPVLARPTSFDFFNVFSNFFIGFQTDSLNTILLSLWPILVLVGFTFISKRREHESETMYFIIASFLPIIMAFVVSALLQPLFLSRYLIICLPSIYILAVYYLSSYKGKIGDFAVSVLIVFMVLMLAVQAGEMRSPVKENYKSAVEYIERRAQPSDIFVVSAPFITYPVEYYYDGKARLTTFPKWERYTESLVPEPYSPDLIETRMKEFAAVYEDMYLLLGYDQGYEEDVRLYMDTHYQRLEVKPFSPGLTLYVYRLRYI